LPSPSESNSAQASPVLLPDHRVSSKFQMTVWPPVPQAPPKQNSSKSFCPGSSSAPCTSVVHCWAAAPDALPKSIASARNTESINGKRLYMCDPPES
jgi:hypothetical protein